MAFILTSFFVIPSVIYGINEASNTLDDILNFNYTEYLKNKISNVDKRLQITILELEYKNAKKLYKNYNDEYKNFILKKNGIYKINEIKLKRNHYYNLMNESMKQIKNLKKEIII